MSDIQRTSSFFDSKDAISASPRTCVGHVCARPCGVCPALAAGTGTPHAVLSHVSAEREDEVPLAWDAGLAFSDGCAVSQRDGLTVI